MDEQELKSLFSAVPGDAPPPTFSASDVATESKRQTVRLRNRIAVGGSAVILVLAGFGVFGVLSGLHLELGPTGASSNDAAVAQSQAGPGAGQPQPSAGRPLAEGGPPNFATPPPQQGGSGATKTGPAAEGAFGCEKVDGELATALAGELPAHVTPAMATVGDACSTGTRAAGFPVPGGTVSAAVYPAGARTPDSVPESGQKASAVTPSGGTLVLISKPDPGGQAPYATELQQFANDLAPRF